MRFAYIETGGRFNEQASRGPNSAKGLFQFTPGTAAAYGISGRELDAVANTDAAARLYQDNQHALTRQHDKDHRPYLSGKPQPIYMAHQQGAGGYRSIQAAVASGSFSRAKTRGRTSSTTCRAKRMRPAPGSSRPTPAARWPSSRRCPTRTWPRPS
jgi:hypothetical protein